MDKTYNVVLDEHQLNILAKIVRRSLGNTRDKARRRMLGLLYDELTATLSMEMIIEAQKNLQNLQTDLDNFKKAEKRKHLKVVK